MTTTIRIEGAIDRHAPDPSASSDPTRVWIGNVMVQWTGDRSPLTRTAGIMRVTTGRGTGDLKWGSHVLVLRWIGDPPPPEIARSVYDLVEDGGPDPRPIGGEWLSQERTPGQPSYRLAKAS